MTMTVSNRYDVAVIGAGLAGLAAATFAADQGCTTLLVGRPGETWFTGGLVDLMGVHPIESGRKWENPWQGIQALVADQPRHPYACLSPDDIRTALNGFYRCLQEADLPYQTGDPLNSELITSVGTIKTTHGFPRTMQPGVLALKRKAPCLLVDIKGLRGFSARLIAEQMKPDWTGLKTLTVPYSNGLAELAPLPLARDLEVPARRARLAESIAPYVHEVEFVGLPAVMGVNGAHRILAEFSSMVGRPVFEIPTMPPSIPGLRMKDALTQSLLQKKVSCAIQAQPVTVARTADGRFRLGGGAFEPGNDVLADGVILATGRFLGGGLTATPAGIREPLFDLPVSQPLERREWHRVDVFDPSGHAINQAGLETDRYLRPLGKNGGPVYDNLFAVGGILAHQDWMRLKCGAGMSIATAYHAVSSWKALKS